MGDNLVRNAVLNFISRAMITGVKTNVLYKARTRVFQPLSDFRSEGNYQSQEGLRGTCNKKSKGRGQLAGYCKDVRSLCQRKGTASSVRFF